MTFDPGGLGMWGDGGELLQSVAEGAAAEAPPAGRGAGLEFSWLGQRFSKYHRLHHHRAVYSYEQSLRTGWNLISAKLNLVDESREPALNNGAMTLDVKQGVCKQLGACRISGSLDLLQNQTRSPIRLYGTADENFDFEASTKPGWDFVGRYTTTICRTLTLSPGLEGRRFYPTEACFPCTVVDICDRRLCCAVKDTYLIIDLSADRRHPATRSATIHPPAWLD